MPERKKLLLWLIAMILFFLLLLVTIWLVYNYRIHQLDRQLERPTVSFHPNTLLQEKSNTQQTTCI
ncbi:hypothetical protein [Pseudobacter ginsenosidimutans]|jgi:cytoskeletal protein RodZ|uniref:Uncharacterized protein n=1 Tax=Pseudobacter ginsenosidimutans TaxID=661488 RepID=A0A4Q7MS97_9BACT|nr:hypothetical protein [Pseudobacter ginsenosidimutans]QEC41546.1 hypothetical protein FSB84_07480 [Pseudobacter ginsenosidimutans]RZS71672.1 hypothetical protein EV199_3580 [Pseudobacter ginsenosidimutans]